MTPAEQFAKDIAKALAGKPTSFVVDGTTIASVSPDGGLGLTTATVAAAAVPGLIAWLTATYTEAKK